MNVKRIVFAIVASTGLSSWCRFLRRRGQVTILCYHAPLPAFMDRHLVWLRRHYNIIALQDYLCWRRGEIASLPPRALVVTLDDGHASNATLLDVFRRHDVRPTIFLCSDIVGTQRRYWWQAVPDDAKLQRMKRLPDEERLAALRDLGFEETGEAMQRSSLSAKEIQAMRGVVDFQAHTRLHPVLPMCSSVRAREEIAGCRSALRDRFGLSTVALAYPNGDYSERDVVFAREAGFSCALSIDAGVNDDTTDLFLLKRILLPDDASLNELALKASGLWDLLMRSIGRRPAFGRKPVWEDRRHVRT
jgi:peptidoglycan/xylan/chitin deacetylase (PgdA/CDA1 family)